MSVPTKESRRAAAAAFSRSRPPEDPERVAAERDTYALYLADHIERVVAKAPPFTDEQVDKLVTLLRAS